LRSRNEEESLCSVKRKKETDALRRSTMSRNPSVTLLTTVAAVIVVGFSVPSLAHDRGCEGCTPGYWKNHPEAWPATGYSPGDSFFDVFFEVTVENGGPTLLDALNAQGGGISALARHAVAALLNAASPCVDYYFYECEVIGIVRVALWCDDDVIEYWKDVFDDLNNLGCPE
jgi:hypothetical protein